MDTERIERELEEVKRAVDNYMAAGPSACWGENYLKACHKEALLTRKLAEAKGEK